MLFTNGVRQKMNPHLTAIYISSNRYSADL